MGGTQEFLLDASCTGLGKALNVDPELMDMPTDAAENIAFFDPRPRDGGRAYDDVDDVPDDGFFEPVDFKGAFGPDLWLQDWSWLQEDARWTACAWTQDPTTTSQTRSGDSEGVAWIRVRSSKGNKRQGMQAPCYGTCAYTFSMTRFPFQKKK